MVAGDPDARDATLALTVGAGQLREPFEGLSHLTEHLTMAASNLEQKAIDYDGVANAYTAFDRTVYVANCAPRYVGALLRSVSSGRLAHSGGEVRRLDDATRSAARRRRGPIPTFGSGARSGVVT